MLWLYYIIWLRIKKRMHCNFTALPAWPFQSNIFAVNECMLIFNRPLDITWATRICALQGPSVTGVSADPECRVPVLQGDSRFSLATRRFKQPLFNTPSTMPHTYFHNAPIRRKVSWCIIHAAMMCLRRSPFLLGAKSVSESDTYSQTFGHS